MPSPDEPVRALVVEDERDLADLLGRVLALEGWQVEVARTGRDAVRPRDRGPDVVVLDVMLPDMTGMDVLRHLRTVDPAVCVLFLTARDAVEDRVAGITAGGDDYVTKPFAMEELLARLRGLVRRARVVSPLPDDDALRVGDLTLDEDAREVTRGGDLIDLTVTEFELLRYLMRNPRRVLSKTQILDRVWSYDFGGDAHVVELYISYLRRKIDRGRPPMIHTVRGVGYVLKPAADHP